LHLPARRLPDASRPGCEYEPPPQVAHAANLRAIAPDGGYRERALLVAE